MYQPPRAECFVQLPSLNVHSRVGRFKRLSVNRTLVRPTRRDPGSGRGRPHRPCCSTGVVPEPLLEVPVSFPFLVPVSKCADAIFCRTSELRYSMYASAIVRACVRAVSPRRQRTFRRVLRPTGIALILRHSWTTQARAGVFTLGDAQSFLG